MDYNKLKEILQKKRSDRTNEDIKQILNLTKDLNFVKEINDKSIHIDICKNAELKVFKEDEIIFTSINSESGNVMPLENFVIISGSANLYNCSIDNEKKMVSYNIK
jgi:hypothetical protein